MSAEKNLDPILFLDAKLSPKLRVAGFLASGFGSGWSPKAPGTAGSLLALLMFFPLLKLSLWIQLALILSFVALGYWATYTCSQANGIEDDPRVVVDEWLGMWIAMLTLPVQLGWLVAAFVLFRVFDIFKIFPADIFDRRPGAAAVLLDDIISGIYACMLLVLFKAGMNL